MNEEKKDEGQDIPQSVILTIEFTNEGKFRVDGPITNEMLSFYMLEKAKDIVKTHNLKIAYEESRSRIQKPGGIMGFVRGDKRF